MVSAEPLDKVVAALLDFERYGEFFGVESAVVMRREADALVVKTTAKRLGVVCAYVYRQTTPKRSPNEYLIERRSIDAEGDGTTKNMTTDYYLKAITIDGKPYTYIRCYDATDYVRQIVGQFTVMKWNNASAHKDGLKQLVKAAASMP
jgi:hypothetical protein